MKDELKKLEPLSRELEPGGAFRRDLIATAVQYAEEFLDDLENKPTYVPDTTGLEQIDEVAIGQKQELQEILSLLGSTVDTMGINPAGPGHFGYIPGGGIFSSSLGDLLAAVSNRYSGLFYASPGAVKLENRLIDWVRDLVGYPDIALGNLTTGGSIANLIAVCTARDKMQITRKPLSESVIYYTVQTHHCVAKAIRIAGLSECITRIIPLDLEFRMDAEQLEIQVKKDIEEGLTPFFLASSYGSTDTGAVDPFDEIGRICSEYGIWFHIDAAYGGFFMLLDSFKERYQSIDQSDSIVLDPHKSLFLPYGSGIVLIRDGKALFESFHYKANYLQDAYADGLEISPCDLSPELTKHFRGLRMWLPLQLHGIAPFQACLQEKVLLTQYFYKQVQLLGFEVGPPPALSVCIYRYVPADGDPNEFNRQLTRLIQQDGRIFISTTEIEGIFWLRLAVLSFRTHLEHIERYLSILKEKVLLIEAQELT